MTKKKGEMSDRFPNLSAPTTATTKEIADEDSISSNFKVKKFTKESNFGYRKYETFDIVSETGDSIYSPQYEEVIKLDGGQIYVAEDKIREIVQDELAKYFNGVNFNKNES